MEEETHLEEASQRDSVVLAQMEEWERINSLEARLEVSATLIRLGAIQGELKTSHSSSLAQNPVKISLDLGILGAILAPRLSVKEENEG